MRTCLGWGRQPSWEWLLGNGRQPFGPCATQSTALYHQHLDTMNKLAGSECGQSGGSRKQNALDPHALVSHKVQQQRYRGWLVQQAYPVPQAKHETPRRNCMSSCSLEIGTGISKYGTVFN